MNKKLITLAVQSAIFSAATMMTNSAFAFEQDKLAEIEKKASTANVSSTEKVETENDAPEKIIVTGSRLRRDSFSVATPLVALGRAEIDDTGLGSLSEILVDNIPSLSEGSSNTNSQGSVQNTGLSTVQLRNLGTNRTLTLIDGRRVVSNSYSGNYVSLSTIPTGMVDRVEIISGGASATYGSDAVAGVVNIITQQDKEGLEFKVRGGTTTDGGGDEFTLDLSYGSEFAGGDGYMYMSANYDKQYGISFEDRKRSQQEASFQYDAEKMCNQMDTENDYQCMRNITAADWRNRSDGMPGGVFLESTKNDKQFWYDETGLRDDWSIQNEEKYGINTEQYVAIKIPDEKASVAVKFDYELTDSISSYFQVQYSETNSENIKSPEDEYENAFAVTIDPVTGELGGVTPGRIDINNPYVPQEIIDSNPYKDRIYWDRRFNEVGPVITDNNRTTVRTWAGLQGTMLDDNWDWDISAGYGKFKQEQTRYNELNTLHVKNALDAEYAADGTTIQCASEEARAEGCAPLNLFGINSISTEAADYIRANPRITTEIEQINVVGYIAGDLFEMPAGAVSTVFGVEYRKDSQAIETNDEQRWGGVTFNVVPSFEGDIDVSEVFAEAAIPLLRDVVAAKNLTLEVSGRVADYSIDHVGTVGSYKIGTTWEPIEGYMFRANVATAQRAPTITELMSPARGDYDSFDDICKGITASSEGTLDDNCRMEPTIVAAIENDADGEFPGYDNNYSPNMGNPEVKEETAKTFTAGLTMAPSFIEDFRLAIDYYQIEVEDAIDTYDNYDIMKGCYDSPSGAAWGPDNAHCNNISRDSEGEIEQILQRVYNLDELKTRGVDIAAEYKMDMNSFGRLYFKADMTHVIEHSKSFYEDAVLVTNDYLGYLEDGIFENKASASLTWYNEGWRVRWSTKFRSDMKYDRATEEKYYAPLDANEPGIFTVNDANCAEGNAACVANPEDPEFFNIGSYIKHSMSVSYTFEMNNDNEIRVFGGVNNIFNNYGDFIIDGTGNYSSKYGGGEGRFVYLGAQFDF